MDNWFQSTIEIRWWHRAKQALKIYLQMKPLDNYFRVNLINQDRINLLSTLKDQQMLLCMIIKTKIGQLHQELAHKSYQISGMIKLV